MKYFLQNGNKVSSELNYGMQVWFHEKTELAILFARRISYFLSVILLFQNLSNRDFREELTLTNADNCVVLDDDAYFTPKQISNIMGENMLKSFLVAHFNTRGLTKNKNLIEEFITEINHSPEVIGISETKINENISLNLQISNYLFFHNDSFTDAGGTGMYIKQN